jgi:hypothetical protein
VIVPALLIFSLISGKQGKYLLPLFPLIALLFARWLAALDKDAGGFRLRFVGALLSFSGLVLVALPWLPIGPEWLSQVPVMWGMALLVLGAVLFRVDLKPGAAVRATSLAMVLWTATLYLALVPLLAVEYDLRPMSHTLHGLQQNGRPLAWLGKYHGQFHFLGRLQTRIEPLAGSDRLHGWLVANPDGYLLVNYRTARPDIPDSLQVQPYRGGRLVLWPAVQLLQDTHRLDALAGSG